MIRSANILLGCILLPAVLPGCMYALWPWSPGDAQAGDPDDAPLPEVPGLTPQQVERLVAYAEEHPDLAWSVAQMRPELQDRLGNRYYRPHAEQAPSPPAPDLASVEARRRQADALVAKLREADENELPEIARGLAELGPAAMVPLKLATLSDDFELRRRASRVASRLRWRLACSEVMELAFPGLVDAMSGQEARARTDRVDLIAGRAGAWAIDFLRECLADPQDYIRQRAVDGLARAASAWRTSEDAKTTIAGILASLLHDEDRDMRLLAVGALAKASMVDVERVASMLDDESLEVRLTAIQAIGSTSKPAGLRHLTPLLKDPQWRVRAATLDALRSLVEERQAWRIAPAVTEMLKDEDSFVRAKAADLLEAWRPWLKVEKERRDKQEKS